MNHIAHIKYVNGEESVQTIEEHNKSVAGMAADFAKNIQVGDVSRYVYTIGRNHDIGKSSDDFGQHIRTGNHDLVDHKTAGARELAERELIAGAFCVEGHHGGLPNGKGSGNSGLIYKLTEAKIPEYEKKLADIPQDLKDIYVGYKNPEKQCFENMSVIRKMFSCLVDADFLDTENFMSENGNSERGNYKDISSLYDDMQEEIKKLLENPTSETNQIRAGVLRKCIEIGKTAKKGFFLFTSPCGVGKTKSSMAFALEHAKKCGLERIIYVMPFTTIINQNAIVYSQIFGEENVVQHHGLANMENKPKDEKHRLATENWDAPIILTTEVQFFESLFSNKPSKCRKLHNITNSLIIFDEAQKLPEDYLTPCLEELRCLVNYCGCSVVFQSATQPSIDKLLKDCNFIELCPDYKDLFVKMRRNCVRNLGKMEIMDIVKEVSERQQILCIVNIRKTAQKLYQEIVNGKKTEGIYCLNRFEVPKHIQDQIEEIKERLKQGKKCIVISTSLVEAGVDFDFPEVWREITSLDSIIQAAGRCNREGIDVAKLHFVYVFSLSEKCNSELQRYQYITEEVWRIYQEIDSPEAIQNYFDRIHKIDKLDKKKIMKLSENGNFPFNTVAKLFNIIESDTIDIIVNYDNDSNDYLKNLNDCIAKGNSGKFYRRKLQNYTVSIHPKDFKTIMDMGYIITLDDGTYIIYDTNAIYDNNVGLEVTETISTGGLFI